MRSLLSLSALVWVAGCHSGVLYLDDLPPMDTGATGDPTDPGDLGTDTTTPEEPATEAPTVEPPVGEGFVQVWLADRTSGPTGWYAALFGESLQGYLNPIECWNHGLCIEQMPTQPGEVLNLLPAPIWDWSTPTHLDVGSAIWVNSVTLPLDPPSVEPSSSYYTPPLPIAWDHPASLTVRFPEDVPFAAFNGLVNLTPPPLVTPVIANGESAAYNESWSELSGSTSELVHLEWTPSNTGTLYLTVMAADHIYLQLLEDDGVEDIDLALYPGTPDRLTTSLVLDRRTTSTVEVGDARLTTVARSVWEVAVRHR